MPGWTAVKRGVTINYDLENSPLQIRTDSVVGSNEKVAVRFMNAQGTMIGNVQLSFSTTLTYSFSHCSNSQSNFPTSLPTETDKIWKITLTRTSGIRIVIHCNNKEVLNVVLSDNTCIDSEWRDYWSRDVDKIYFLPSYDKASDYYRLGK